MKACRELERKFGLKQVENKRKELLEPYLKKADYQSGDVKKQVSNIVKSVFGSYRFQSFGEYSALLSCFNIETKQVKGEFDGVTYNGIVYTMTDDTGKPLCTPIKSSLIGKRYGYEGLEKRIGYNIREYKAKMAAEDSERSGTCHARLPWRPGDICPSAYWERHRYGIP